MLCGEHTCFIIKLHFLQNNFILLQSLHVIYKFVRHAFFAGVFFMVGFWRLRHITFKSDPFVVWMDVVWIDLVWIGVVWSALMWCGWTGVRFVLCGD